MDKPNYDSRILHSIIWCREEDSNLHGSPRQYLKLVRLPIPPSRLERRGNLIIKGAFVNETA